MNCEQDFGEGGLGVTLTLRLLMHGKVRASRRRRSRPNSFIYVPALLINLLLLYLCVL